MIIKNQGKYILILSHDPCDIFRFFNVNSMHGLSLKECMEYGNSKDDAYIAGLCNVTPNGGYFVFINLSRCTDVISTTLLVYHEMMHLAGYLWDFNMYDFGEEMITFAELEALKTVNQINQIL